MFNQFLSQGQGFFQIESHNTFWFNITGSLACKMNNFVQNKSQVTKALEHRMKKDNWKR